MHDAASSAPAPSTGSEARAGFAYDAGAEPLDGPPLRIAFASYRSHPHVGGQGVYVRAVTRALADLGHQVDVVSGPPYPDLDPRVGLVKLPSLDLFARKRAVLAFRPSFLARPADLAEWTLHNSGAFGEMYAFGLRFAAWWRENGARYDIIHDNQTLAGPMRALTEGGAPMIATLHHPISVDLRLALAAERRLHYRVLVRRWHSFLRAQARTARALPPLLTVSDAAKRQAVTDFQHTPLRIHVAANGVDDQMFHPRPDTPRDPNLIVTAASADVPLKGLAVLIKAMARLRDSHPHTQLTVIGRLREGPAKRALDAAGLGERVVFVSGVSSADIAALYARAAVVACPSLFEGFGLPAAEAMACGAAVVASDGGGLPEVVGDAGRITPAGDDAALAKTLAELLDDPAARLALGARAAARAQSAFNWHDHAATAVSLYRQVVARTAQDSLARGSDGTQVERHRAHHPA